MAEITIKDVARECGVGVSTVSRALNDNPDINHKTKEKILQVVQRLGYIPNNSARNLKRVEAKSIAILVKGITNPFFTSMIEVIEEKIEKMGYSMVLHHVESKENEVEVALELIKEKRLQGIIFLGGEFNQSKERLALLSVPYIFSTAGIKPKENEQHTYSILGVDDYAEAKKVTEFLIGLGHKDIAIICTDLSDESVGTLRLNGYKDALSEAKIKVKEELVCQLPNDETHDVYRMEHGYNAAKKLIDSGVEFTALFAISDTLAIGASRALREAGIKVPEDVSVIGFDGIDLGDFVAPRLTSLKQPTDEIAAASIDLLFDLIQEKSENKHIVFEGSIIERESTGKRK